jgi:hypothetical protein
LLLLLHWQVRSHHSRSCCFLHGSAPAAIAAAAAPAQNLRLSNLQRYIAAASAAACCPCNVLLEVRPHFSFQTPLHAAFHHLLLRQLQQQLRALQTSHNQHFPGWDERILLVLLRAATADRVQATAHGHCARPSISLTPSCTNACTRN